MIIADALARSGRRVEAVAALRTALAGRLNSRDCIRAARIAHLIDASDLELRALSAPSPALLSDGQLARLAQLQLALKHPVHLERTIASARNRTFVSDADLIRLCTVMVEAWHEDATLTLLRRVLREGAGPEVLLAWTSLVVSRLDGPQDVLDCLDSFEGCPNWARHFARGRAWMALDRTDEALQSLRLASRLAPSEPRVWFELAVLCRRMGDGQESDDAFHKVLELRPNDVTAMRLLGLHHTYRGDDPELTRIMTVLGSVDRLPVGRHVEAHYAAGKAFEDLGQHATAFAHFAEAGRLHKQLVPWSPEPLSRLNAHLMDPRTTLWLRQIQDAGAPGENPVFVVGMPRSGTTLIEQTLSCHAAIFGAGELKLAEQLLHGLRVAGRELRTLTPHQKAASTIATDATLRERGEAYLCATRAMGGSASRVVDKMPGNYQWLGLIAAMLPQARFIHVRRHPLDSCLSQFKLHFGGEVPYSYDLSDLAARYRAYDEIMTHWTQLIPPSRIYTVRYEDLVLDHEAIARELVAFCGLDWDSACLRFTASRRPVRTASALQVREPLNRAGIGKWRAYQDFIAPLSEPLRDLVERYEALPSGALRQSFS